MFNSIISFLKSVAFIPVLLGAMLALGYAINTLVPFEYLTIFFGIIRRFGSVFDFIWDTTTLWLLVGLRLQIEVVYWLFRGTITLLTFFFNDK